MKLRLLLCGALAPLAPLALGEQQLYELLATKTSDGTCEIVSWRPTQLHKDVVGRSSAVLEHILLPEDPEEGYVSLLKAYGSEVDSILVELGKQCENLPLLWQKNEHSDSGYQTPFLSLESVAKPLPPPPQLNITPLVWSGRPENRVDLVFFADGYTVDEESKFLADAKRLAADISANQTFATVKPLLNIWAAFTSSNESGLGTKETPKDTAFGLYREGTELRAIYCGKKPVARSACASMGASCDYPILLGNSPYYGGLGGEFSISTSSILNGALVLRHELGHSIIKVGEEYDGGYAYFGPNSAYPPLSSMKWGHWLTEQPGSSEGKIIPQRAVSPLQAYPWTMLNKTTPFTALFNSSGTYSSHMIRFSFSGLPKKRHLTVFLDSVDIGWEPKPGVGLDRWHYDIFRNESLGAGSHNLTFALGRDADDRLAQLCSFEIVEYGDRSEFNFTPGFIDSRCGTGTSYRPTNEGCLMRQVVLPQFCKPCTEGLWLQLLKRVDMIDDIEIIRNAEWPDRHVTIHLTPVSLGQFRTEPSSNQDSIRITWKLNGTILPQFTDATTIELDLERASGEWTVDLRLITPEVRVDPKDRLTTSRTFFV